MVDRAVVGSAFGRETKGDRGVNIFMRAEEACSARTEPRTPGCTPGFIYVYPALRGTGDVTNTCAFPKASSPQALIRSVCVKV